MAIKDMYLTASTEIPSNGFGEIKFEADEDVMHLDLRKLIELNLYPRSPHVKSYNHDLAFNGCGRRIRSLIEAIKRGEALPPVNVFLSNDGAVGGICLPDGRHRSMLLYAAGYTSIPACVPLLYSDEIFGLIGADEPDSRIILLSDEFELSPSM